MQRFSLPNTYMFEAPPVSQPLACKNHIYIHIRQTSFFFYEPLHKPNLFLLSSNSIITSCYMQCKRNTLFFTPINLNIHVSLVMTHLQKFPFLTPVSWNRNSIPVRFQKYQELGVCCCGIPYLNIYT